MKVSSLTSMAGRDEFHRVPISKRKVRDAVEGIPTGGSQNAILRYGRVTLCATIWGSCVLSAAAASISLETAPPVVVQTDPVAGSTHVNPGLHELRVTFSKPMQDRSWSWSTWGEENFPETTGQPSYLPDGRTCVLPVKLKPGRFYATWLNSEQFKNFTDADGRPAVPYLLTFTTGHTVSDRKFVRVVLDDNQMTFEGQPASWNTLEALLSGIPDREQTVLEWAIPSTQITIQKQNEWTYRFMKLAREYGFEYSSYVGVQSFDSSGAQSAVREVAAQFAGAIQGRNNERLRALSTDAVVSGWVDAVTHFGDELRVALKEAGVGFEPLGRIEEVLVEGDLAAVKTAHLSEKKAYLALFFCRTPEGWRNCALQNSPQSKSLQQNFKEFADRENAVEKLSGETSR